MLVGRSEVLEPAWQKSSGNIEEKMSSQRVHQSNGGDLSSTQNNSMGSLIKCPVGVNYFHRSPEDSHATGKGKQQ